MALINLNYVAEVFSQNCHLWRLENVFFLMVQGFFKNLITEVLVPKMDFRYSVFQN